MLIDQCLASFLIRSRSTFPGNGAAHSGLENHPQTCLQGQSDPDSSSLRICYSQSYVIKNMNKRLVVGRLDFWQWGIGRLDGKNSETIRVMAAVALLSNYVNHSIPLFILVF